MRLRADAVAIVLALATSAYSTSVRAQAEQPNAATPTDADITRAIEIVQADPNLATERTIKTLKWKDAKDPKPFKPPSWLAWIAGFFGWVAQSARVLVWLAAIVLAGLLVVFVVRLIRARVEAQGEDEFVAPTHVRDLDIRPESLPDDLGAAARALWDRGEHRAALALLYRGLLSRLAHVHKVPIRDSSTEGDCLALAATHLTQQRHQYASQLVNVWQRFVYAGQDIQTATVYTLCDEFAGALDRGAA